MQKACVDAGRDPRTVQLLAVSKHHHVDAIRCLYDLGQRHFGENYMQELQGKQEALVDLKDLCWHMIGPLQRRKAKALRQSGAALESLDSLRLLEALDRAWAEHNNPLRLMVQVNLAAEEQKSGCTLAQLPKLITAIRQRPYCNLRGLMLIPPLDASEQSTRLYFRHLRQLGQEHELPELSMGMSGDLELAIAEGSNWVRIGTAIFGPRPRPLSL